jgi:hypothetical protein
VQRRLIEMRGAVITTGNLRVMEWAAAQPRWNCAAFTGRYSYTKGRPRRTPYSL